jgi:O-antigen ligase
MALWKAAVAMWREKPVLGIGPDNFRMRFYAYVDRMDDDLAINKGIHRAHNLFLNMLAEQGAVGAAAYLLLLAAILVRAVQGWRRAGVTAETLGLSGALGAFFVGNLFDTIFYYHTYMILVLTIFAAWDAVAREPEG